MMVNDKSLRSEEIYFGDTKLDYNWGYFCMDDIIESITKLSADRYFVVTDSPVYELYGKALEKKLSSHRPTHFLKSPSGEDFKSLGVLTSYLQECFNNGVSRQSIVIGFGGGIPGNLAGLLSSLLFRGIRFVQIPTTSVAMFDSVLSLKQAVNSNLSKNSIGSFYVPEAIYSDLSLLSTLPENHRRSGICETIKNVLSIVPKELETLKSNLKGAIEGDNLALGYILKSSITAKQLVMLNDKFEKKKAIVLEYGHTIGHALEILLSKDRNVSQITHGEAVGLGMIVAAHISHEMEILGEKDLEMHYELLEEISSPISVSHFIESSSILELLKSDNKRGYINAKTNETPMILLKKLGDPIYSEGYPLYSTPDAMIERNLKRIFQPHKHAVRAK